MGGIKRFTPKILTIFTFYFFLTSCVSGDKLAAFEVVLNSDSFNYYYHPELESRHPLYILETRYINEVALKKELSINLEVLKVSNISKLPTKNYIRIHNLETIKDTIRVEFEYPAEGAYFKYILIKEDNLWQIKEKSIVEK